MSGPRCALALALGFVALLTAGAVNAAGKKVLLLGFSGRGAAQLRAKIGEALTGHTVVPHRGVVSAARKLRLSLACIDDNVKGLARELGANAVVCGELKPRKRLNLFVFAGASGRMLKMVVLPLNRRSTPQADALAGALAKLEQAFGRIGGAARPLRPGWRLGGAVAAGDKKSSEAGLDAELERLSSEVVGVRSAALEALARRSHWRVMVPLACTLMWDGARAVRAAAMRYAATQLDAAVVAGLQVAADLETGPKLKARLRKLHQRNGQRVAARAAKLAARDPLKRLRAAQALGGVAHTSALAPLIRAAGDPDPGVRLKALEALRNYGQPSARLAVERARQDSAAVVARLARQMLKEHARLSAWRAFYNSYPRVMKKTRAKEPGWRAEAAIALGVNGDEVAAKRLDELLRQDSSEAVRLAAAWSLAALGGPRSVLALLWASSNDPAARVRAAAGQFIKASQGTASMIEQLEQSDDAKVRENAAAAAGLRPSSASRPHLARAGLCDPSAGVRAAALHGLARDRSDLARNLLRLSMFRDPDEDVRRRAMMLYALVGWSDSRGSTAAGASKETATWMGKDAEIPTALTRTHTAAPQAETRPEPPEPRCPTGCRALRLRVGPSMLFMRSFGVENPQRDTRGMTSTPVAGFMVGFEAYPAAWWTKGWLANVGLGFEFQRFFGLSWKTDNDPDTSTAITFQSWALELLRLRYQPVRREELPTLFFRFAIRRQDVLMNDPSDAAAHIPDLSATSVDLGLSARVPIGWLALHLGFDIMPVTSWGEITEEGEYGSGTGWGLLATAGLGGDISDRVGLRLDLSYSRYHVAFDRGSAARRRAGGAADQYLRGLLYLTTGL